jgi:small subunit ribosomal protein S17
MTTQINERRKVRVGRVVSDAMDKTVVVAVERRVVHRFYGKTMRHVTKFNAHDEQNAYRVGDIIRMTETRPLSKTKRWRVTELLVRQDLPELEPAVAAEVVVEEEANKRRRTGPTKASLRAAAKRAAANVEVAPVSKTTKKTPKAIPEVEAENNAVTENTEANTEEESAS